MKQPGNQSLRMRVTRIKFFKFNSKIFSLNYRIEYDAYRSDLEMLLQSPSSGQSSALAEAQRTYDVFYCQNNIFEFCISLIIFEHKNIKSNLKSCEQMCQLNYGS